MRGERLRPAAAGAARGAPSRERSPQPRVHVIGDQHELGRRARATASAGTSRPTIAGHGRARDTRRRASTANVAAARRRGQQLEQLAAPGRDTRSVVARETLERHPGEQPAGDRRARQAASAAISSDAMRARRPARRQPPLAGEARLEVLDGVDRGRVDAVQQGEVAARRSRPAHERRQHAGEGQDAARRDPLGGHARRIDRGRELSAATQALVAGGLVEQHERRWTRPRAGGSSSRPARCGRARAAR